MSKIMLSVAPVCHENADVPNESKNPVLAENIAKEVIECAKLGVSMVHLHVRNQEGKQTNDISYFTQTIDLIREESDIIIQGSTGGVAELSLEDRCVSLNEHRVEMASLNMGSANLNDSVYINTITDIRYWATRMRESKIIPEYEIFDLSMIDTVSKIANEGLVTPPLGFNFCLGFENAIQAKPKNLFCLKQSLPAHSHWGIIHEGMEDMKMLALAAVMGATSIRFGFEDSFYYSKNKIATSNIQLAEYLLEILDKLGFELMTPSEARDLLGVPPLKTN